MKEINTEEFKQISLELLIQFDKYCRENDIKYSLSYGSLLGAVRHMGFIPWDDDVDVMLLRAEYEKLIATFPICYAQYCRLDSLELDKKWNRPYAKFCDNRTLIFENGAEQIEGQSVGIDVFPVDNVPNGKIRWTIHKTFCILLGYLYLIKTVNNGNFRSPLHNLVLRLLKIVLLPFNKRQVAKWCASISKLFRKRKTLFVAYSCEGLYVDQRYPASVFDGYRDVLFENNYFKSVHDADSFLTNCYGDYMQFPPEEKRVSHHSFKAYWKN